MATYLKKVVGTIETDSTDAKVRETLERIIADVRKRGDLCVRELSEKFDGWSPSNFRLSTEEIEALVATVARETIEDIKFAQAQILRFAEAQKAALRDVEVETLPG